MDMENRKKIRRVLQNHINDLQLLRNDVGPLSVAQTYYLDNTEDVINEIQKLQTMLRIELKQIGRN